jgi:Tol biopolymer transport system component
MQRPLRSAHPRRVLIAIVFLLGGGLASAASLPPRLRFRTIRGDRVIVHFHQGIEELARQAVTLGDEILAAHEERYQVQVRPVHVVLTDTQDDPNGSAAPLPYPLVYVRVAAPHGNDELGNYEGWLRLVLTHELAHVVHMDQARGLVKVGRKVLGRAPYLFPNAFTPGWMLEGLASYEETEGTAFGRGRDPDSRMVRRMAALDRRFLREDEAVIALDRWPAGQGLYLFGEGFVRDLSEQFGPKTLPELARVHAGRPFPYLDERTSAKVTGESFQAQWKRWTEEAIADAEEEADARAARGLTPSFALTRSGVREVSPRFSPDGQWIAYTSRTLDRERCIRVMRADGSGDRKVTRRNGGATTSWTPDGRFLVYDEPEVYETFAVRSDIRVVEVETGRVRPLTRGARAREPDVSPDGRTVVFVRQEADHSELATIGIDGAGPRDLTASPPGTQWSDPCWSPAGDRVTAGRWQPGGWLDIVLLDMASGELTELTHDRAKDVEPVFTPDGRYILFRSDRDGVSNVYALRMDDHALLRVTNVLGGAFSPDVSPDGTQLAFASYTSAGYDVHVAPLDVDAAALAETFHDPYGQAHDEAVPSTLPDRSYRPLPAMLPHFWSPYAAGVSGQTRYGIGTGGADPLLRHIYGLEAHYGARTERFGVQGFYQYDRFYPTFLVSVQDVTDPEGADLLRTQNVTLRASLPLARSFRHSQTLSLAWRRERQALLAAGSRTDLGGLEAAWAWSNVQQHPFSISPVDGCRLRLAYLKESPAFGSDLDLSKWTADFRAYHRLFGEGDVLAFRIGGGATVGAPSFRRSFAVGGFPDRSLFDLVATNQTVLRGYPDDAFVGRRFAHSNLEYRIPLAHPQRGFRSMPFFVRHLHASAFADAALAWSGPFRLGDVKTGAGAALGADLYISHAVPVTTVIGVAHGFAERGETRVYFRAGLSF